MSAHLESSEVLSRLRLAMLQFIERADRAIGTSTRSLQQGYGWLREQHIPLVEREFRQAEIRLGEARLAYNSAKLAVKMEQKASYDEEERQFLKAKARFDACCECQQRSQAWIRLLEKEGQAHLAPIRQLGRRIDDMRERGVGELERKIAHVTEYLGQAGGEPS